jgi:hypothetical protein
MTMRELIQRETLTISSPNPHNSGIRFDYKPPQSPDESYRVTSPHWYMFDFLSQARIKGSLPRANGRSQ